MKLFLFLTALILLSAVDSEGQSRVFDTQIYYGDTASASGWDSLVVGISRRAKNISVFNWDAADTLYVAIRNDTTGTQILKIPPTKSFIYPVPLAEHINFIRTKSSSGSLRRDVISTY